MSIHPRGAHRKPPHYAPKLAESVEDLPPRPPTLAPEGTDILALIQAWLQARRDRDWSTASERYTQLAALARRPPEGMTWKLRTAGGTDYVAAD